MPSRSMSVFFQVHSKKVFTFGLLLALGLFLLVPLQTHAQERLISDFQATQGLANYCGGESVSGVIATGMCYLGMVITAVLEFIVWILGLLTLLVIEVLIVFAKYNDFSNVSIVQSGWRIVRDLVNMFFIVVLLVSAFATIIGYDRASFHYTKVLPKLLVMAILVNFSRTLIQVLVDFSQVIMLTFVNAFQQSAAGNFVNGLGMTQVLALPGTQSGVGSGSGGQPPNVSGGEGSVSITNIILALMLAVFLMSIMLATMLILMIYLIARIVGIWIALIFSPAAFFATALPDRLKKYVSTVTNEYWSKLAGLLTGGPTIAFFLWLTLSAIQQSGDAGLARGLNFTSSNEVLNAVIQSGVGNSGAIASFVVGITLMLMGVNIAVSSAAIAGKQVSGIASGIARFGKSAGARLAFAPTVGAAALGARGAAAGARAVDRRVDLTGRASRGLLQAVGRVPGVGSALRPALLRGATYRRREAAEEAGKEQKYLKHLSSEEKRSVKDIYGGNVMASMADRRVKESLLSNLSSEKTAKQQQKARQSELMKSAGYQQTAEKLGEPEAKRLAGLQAKDEAQKAQAALIKEGKTIAQNEGDVNAVQKYQDILEKNPALSSDFSKDMAKMRDDPEKLNGLSRDAKQNVSVALEALPQDTLQATQDGKVTGFDQAKLEAFYDKNSSNRELVDTVKQAVSFVEQSPGGVPKQELMSMQKVSLPGGKTQLYGKTDTGTYEKKRTGAQKTAIAKLESNVKGTSGLEPGGGLTDKAQTSVNSALSSGISPSEVIDIADNNQKAAIKSSYKDMAQKGMSGAAGAADKAALDDALSQAMPLLKNLESVDADTQVKILSGIQQGGGAKTISAQWELADFGQREAMQKVMKQAVRRAARVSSKRARDGAASLSDDEKQVEQLVTELKEEFPSKKRGVPSGVKKILHENE